MTDIDLSVYQNYARIMFVCDDYPTEHDLDAWVIYEGGSEQCLGYMVPTGFQIVRTFEIPLDETGKPKDIRGAYILSGWKRSETVQVAGVLIDTPNTVTIQ